MKGKTELVGTLLFIFATGTWFGLYHFLGGWRTGNSDMMELAVFSIAQTFAISYCLFRFYRLTVDYPELT